MLSQKAKATSQENANCSGFEPRCTNEAPTAMTPMTRKIQERVFQR